MAAFAAESHQLFLQQFFQPTMQVPAYPVNLMPYAVRNPAAFLPGQLRAPAGRSTSAFKLPASLPTANAASNRG